MDRIASELFGLEYPLSADELVGSETLQSLQSTSEVVGRDEVGEMAAKLVVAFVVEAPNGGVLDGPVHSLDLSVGPWMLRLGRTVLDVVPGAGEFEGVGPEKFAVCDGFLDERDS